MLVLKINFDRKFNDPRARKIASWRAGRITRFLSGRYGEFGRFRLMTPTSGASAD
jgi:hypothetical protein